MSKIAENKAREAYPKSTEEPYSTGFITKETFNVSKRTGYVKGYDQAMKDIEEFFYDRFNIHPHDCHVIQYVSDTPLETIDDFVKQFKNYMQDEM